MEFLKFDRADAIRGLLKQIGIGSDLGPFLADHLTEVFRRQRADVVIKAIEFIRSGGCSAEGQRDLVSTIVLVESLSVPIELHVTLVSGGQTHHLELLVRINARTSDAGFRITSDVEIQNQWTDADENASG